MSPSDLALMSDEQIVEMIVSLPVGRGAEHLASDVVQAAFLEIRRRYAQEIEVPRTPSGRVRTATSVEIDPERWKAAWYRRRITQVELCRMIGKSYTWANVVAHQGRVNYYVLDRIASELSEVTDDLVWEVASSRERQRMVFA